MSDNESSQWISVDDRLPENKMKMVLAWDRYLEQPRLLLGVHLQTEDYLTHWQPLPEPPKGQSK